MLPDRQIGLKAKRLINESNKENESPNLESEGKTSGSKVVPMKVDYKAATTSEAKKRIIKRAVTKAWISKKAKAKKYAQRYNIPNSTVLPYYRRRKALDSIGKVGRKSLASEEDRDMVLTALDLETRQGRKLRSTL